MIKWCKINRRNINDVFIWDGKVIGMGKPKIEVIVEADEPLPKPNFKRKLINSRRKK